MIGTNWCATGSSSWAKRSGMGVGRPVDRPRSQAWAVNSRAAAAPSTVVGIGRSRMVIGNGSTVPMRIWTGTGPEIHR